MAAVDITTIGIEYDTSGLEKGTRAQDKTRDSANKMADSLGGAEKSTKSVTQATNYYTTALQAAAAAMGISKIIDQIDQYTKFTAQLKLATGSTAEYAASLNAVRQISKDAQSSLAGTGTLYAKIANGTRELGVAQSQVAKITESVNLALKVSGATATEAASAQLQLGQAFASGTLRGEEFNAVNEAAPRLMKALADGMGRPVGALKDMASNGLITSEIMANVLPKALEQLREEAKQVQTISGAFQVLKNNVMEFIGTQSQASGVVSVITGAIGLLADNLVILAGAIVTITATKFANFLSGLAVSAYESVAANRALAAANLATAQSNVAATASTLALADARVIELRQAVLAASGEAALAVTMNGLIPAQARATAASLAHTEALAAQTVAVGAASAGAGILRGALAFLGGPIGLIVTALGVAATAWSVFGDKAEEANDKTTKSTIESSQEVIARLDQEISKLKDRNKLRSENPELAKGSSEANLKALTQAQKDYNEALAGTGKAAGLNATAQAEMVKVLGQAYGQIYQRVNDVNSETKKLTEGTTSEKMKKWLGENGSAAQRMAAAMAEAKKEVGVLTPEMEKLIKAKFADKSIAKEAAFEESARHKMYLAHVKAEQSIQDQINKDAKQFASDQIARTKEVTKEIIAGINEQSKAFLSYNKSLDDHAQRMSDMNKLAQLEIDTLGMSSVQRNTLIEQKKIELALEKQLKDIRASNMAQGEKDILEEKAKTQANIDKSTAELRAQQGEWSKFYGEIYNGLSDSLYRGFEAGKGFGQSFIDSLKNMLKTNILKVSVQAVMDTGMNFLSGGSKEGGASGGGLSSILSMFGGGGSSSAGGAASMIKGLGSTIGIATAMYGIGRAIAGDYKIGGMNSTFSTLIGSGVGARLFGMADKQMGGQTVTGNLGTNDLMRNQAWTQSGGLFRSDRSDTWSYGLSNSVATTSDGKSYTDTKNLESDKALLATLNSAYGTFKNVTTDFAKALGLNAESIAARNDAINFTIGKTNEETDKAINEAFKNISDAMAISLAPGISSLQKESESAFAALGRLATSLLGVNAVMKAVGFAEFGKSLEGANAAQRLSDLSGGIEKLASGAQYFYENFLDEAEKIKPIADQVSATMARLGQSSVDTIPEFKSLVQGLDLTTESGAKMYANLIEIAPQFKAVADYTKEAEKEVVNYVDVQFNAQRKVEVAALEATQALEAQARATMELAKAEKQKTYDDMLQSRLRSGKIGETMTASYDLNPVDFGGFMSGGQFDAAGFNGEIFRKQAKLSLELMAKSSADAINVEDISTVFAGLFEFTKGSEFKNYLFRNLPSTSDNLALVMADFLDASIEGMRLKNWKPSGEGILNVINAQDDIAYQDNLLTQYNRSLTSAGEALRLGIVTQDQYNDAIAKSADIIKEQVRTQEELSANLQKAGIESIAFYFGQIGKSVEELNKVADETAAPLSQVTSAIGRLTSIADVFGISANAAGGKESGITSVANAQIVASAAAIAAGVITSADAAQAAKLLADKSSFAGADKTSIRDISLIFEGLKQFDAKSFENSFMRMNDSLNKGIITQDQYQDIFDQSVSTYQGLDSVTKAVSESMDNLRKSMGGFADQLLIDSQKTTLSQALTMDELMRQYEVAKVAAMTGEAGSVNKFQGLANQVLDASKYGSRAEYNAAFGSVYRDARNLESVGARAAQGENVVTELKNLNKSQTERIDRLEDALLAALVQIAKNTKDTVNTLELAEIP